MIKHRYLVALLSINVFFSTHTLAAKNSSMFDEFTINSPLTLTHNVLIADVSSNISLANNIELIGSPADLLFI